MAVSIALSGGLVLAAQQYTASTRPPASLLSADLPSTQEADWQKALEDIQAHSGVSIPAPPDENKLATLLEAAKSPNITDSVARTLFINLSSAASQGLGSDLPTQNELLSAAFAQLPKTSAGAHTTSELTIVPDSPEALHEYGNDVIAVFGQHQDASAAKVLQLMSAAVDQDNKTYFEQLGGIKDAYRRLLTDLLSVSVPQTLSPLHLSLVNDIEKMIGEIEDMQTTPEDTLRGTAGLQNFTLTLDETNRVLTTLAQQLNKKDILFTKDEPGSAWASFLGASSATSQ
jgi:hypothetical protein